MDKIKDATSINNDIKFNNSFKFLKANYGDVVYSDGKGNDLIKTNENYTNVFICNKPFYFDCETYFEIKVCVDNCKNIFIGFIDAEEKNYDYAFGFGCIGYKGSFCKKSLLLSNDIHSTADKIMKDDQIGKVLIKAGDIIGCYYTTEYTYLTINGQLTQYRNSNKSLKLYIPIIVVDHEQFEIEIVRNVSIVDNSDNQFDFLRIDKKSENFFTEKD